MSIHLNKQDQRILINALYDYADKRRREFADVSAAAKDAECAMRLARLIGSIGDLPEEVV